MEKCACGLADHPGHVLLDHVARPPFRYVYNRERNRYEILDADADVIAECWSEHVAAALVRGLAIAAESPHPSRRSV